MSKRNSQSLCSIDIPVSYHALLTLSFFAACGVLFFVCAFLYSLSYPGQILYLCVGGDAGIAFPLSILHVPQVEHAGNYVHQLLRGVDSRK